MAQVSLIATGAQLGKTSGQIRLSALRMNGYTRTFAVSGYLRVNPFEVEDGQADDPSRGDAKHFLGNWLNYLQQSLNTGSQLQVTSSYGEVALSWTKPPGYDRAPGILEQQMYLKGTGESEINETAVSTNPFVDFFSKVPAGDGSSGVLPAASFGGEVVAVGVKVEFDDSVTIHTNSGATAYSIAPGQEPLTGGGRGIAVLVFDVTPEITSIRQVPERENCFINDDVDIRVTVDMEGPSEGTIQESVNGGAFSTIFSNVAPGTTGEINFPDRSSNNNYSYRIRYNDVSPIQWSATANFSANCDLT